MVWNMGQVETQGILGWGRRKMKYDSYKLLVHAVLFLCIALWAVVSVEASKDKLYSIDKDVLLSGDQDAWFESLTEQELSEHWSYDDGTTVADKIEKLSGMHAKVPVDVKLVGFQGHGQAGYTFTQEEIMRYIKVANSKLKTYIGNVRKNQNRTLPFETQFVYNVKFASPSLLRNIEKKIDDSVPRDYTFVQPALIPVQTVNDVIKNDFARSHMYYTIYILNPNKPKRSQPNSPNDPRKSVPYYYEPDNSGEIIPFLDDSDRYLGCPVAGWMGEADKRFIWLDLSTSPLAYGPQTVGEGIFTEFSLPRVEPQDEDRIQLHHKIPTFQFLPHLVTTIMRSTKLLISPTVDRFPIPYKKYMAVNVVVISDSDNNGQRDTESRESIIRNGGWQPIVDEIKSLAMDGQRIDVLFSKAYFFDCKLCTAAYSHSLKSHTSNVIVGSLKTQVHQYLDGEEMKDWLEHFDANYWGLKHTAALGVDANPEDIEVINVFLFDMETTDILLIDRYHQAVAFDNLVIGIQTNAAAAMVDYSCNSRPLQFQPKNAKRALLAAVLQAGWGISPTHQFWNPHTESLEKDYMWSVGLTPFDYWSQSITLSFSQKDASARHIILSEVNQTISNLHHVFEHFSQYEAQLDEIMDHQNHLYFIRRWNVFSFKLDKTQHFLSLNNFNQALYYILSAKHDLKEMHHMIHSSIAELHPVIVCQNKSVPSGGWSKSIKVVLLALFVVCFSIVVLQSYPDSYLRQKVFPSKRLLIG